MKTRYVLICAASVLGLGSAGLSAVILQDSGVFDRSISAFDPIGQTFMATDAQISTIAFAFSDINPGFPNDPVTMSLYAGSGFGGMLLGSVTQTLPAVLPSTIAPPVFIDFDFTGTALSVGSVYTIAVTTSSSPKIAVVYSDANPYGLGNYISAVDGTNTAFDLNFRVVGVPAPASAGLVAVGAVFAMRRRRSV